MPRRTPKNIQNCSPLILVFRRFCCGPPWPPSHLLLLALSLSLPPLSLCTVPPTGRSWRSCCSLTKGTCMHDWRLGYCQVIILITILPQNVTNQFSCMILHFLYWRSLACSFQQFLVPTSSCHLIHGIFCRHFLSMALSSHV